MAEGRRLRPALARRDRDAALQDHHRPNAPRPDSARTKGRGQGRLQGAQPHDRSRHARLSKARLKPPEGPPLPPDLRLCTNAHTTASLYAAFPAPEARRLANRFEWHYTPKHGSWLDMAESELAVLTNQCLSRRIPDKQTLEKEVAAWERHRNKHHAKPIGNSQPKTPE